MQNTAQLLESPHLHHHCPGKHWGSIVPICGVSNSRQWEETHKNQHPLKMDDLLIRYTTSSLGSRNCALPILQKLLLHPQWSILMCLISNNLPVYKREYGHEIMKRSLESGIKQPSVGAIFCWVQPGHHHISTTNRDGLRHPCRSGTSISNTAPLHLRLKHLLPNDNNYHHPLVTPKFHQIADNYTH
jgi:hypothetical protein